MTTTFFLLFFCVVIQCIRYYKLLQYYATKGNKYIIAIDAILENYLSQKGCQHAIVFVFTLRMSQFLNLIQQFAPVGESRSRIGNFSGGIPNPDLWNPE